MIKSFGVMAWSNRFLDGLVALVIICLTLTSQVRAEDPSGRWKGKWISGSNGHQGPMRARITPSGSGSYDAVFAGRFALVIPFVYRAEMKPVQTWDGIAYTVDKKLGFLGTYRMNSVVQGGQLNANWSAVGDHGQVKMQRIGR